MGGFDLEAGKLDKSADKTMTYRLFCAIRGWMGFDKTQINGVRNGKRIESRGKNTS
jgi:hypothetical protein